VRVDQVIPALSQPDAIGTHALALTDALRSSGIESDVYYGACLTPGLAGRGRPITKLARGGKKRWLLYQSSIGSPVVDLVAARHEPLLVNYHNITPSALLDPWEPSIGLHLDLGRAQLRQLAARCELGIADSDYNRRELEAYGYRRTAVLPLLIDMGARDQAPDPSLMDRLAEQRAAGGVDLLFVGKVSPHKAPHDLVKMIAVYRRLFDDGVRLHLVGSPVGSRYGGAMERFIGSLGLEASVHITGPVGPGELEAYFRNADAFVCASDHEGFCVPVVEAMAHGVPVVAAFAGPYGGGAVPETVADAGLLLDSKDPLRFATAVHRTVTDRELRERLRSAGLRRAADFSLDRTVERMVRLIRRTLSGERDPDVTDTQGGSDR
jgi:L-malate glycosyltransferase